MHRLVQGSGTVPSPSRYGWIVGPAPEPAGEFQDGPGLARLGAQVERGLGEKLTDCPVRPTKFWQFCSLPLILKRRAAGLLN